MVTTAPPKTKKEIALEKIREIDGRLSVVKRMLGSSQAGAREKVDRASKKLKGASGEARFVKIGSCMVEGTDRLEALLAIEESYAELMDLDGKEPVSEAEKLLKKKIEIMRTLI